MNTLNIFLSYASQDYQITKAIAKELTNALGTYANVWLDKWDLEAGFPFKSQLESKLAETHLFIIIYTGVDKLSHGFTGWETGYFEHVMRKSKRTPGGVRSIIPLYLNLPPSAAAEYQGVSLGIGEDSMKFTVDEFRACNTVEEDDPLCKLIKELRTRARTRHAKAHLPPDPDFDSVNPALSAQNIKNAVFEALKKTVRDILKLQRQITIKTTGEALKISAATADLPADADLIPIGDGRPMSTIFGLPDEPMTWAQFLRESTGPQKASWREAISSVVLACPKTKDRAVLSSDQMIAYRVVLTTMTKYWNDAQEFNLYFVELLTRPDYGNEKTSFLLKALEVVCRYRFLFFESDSAYSSQSIPLIHPEQLPEKVANLLLELNLLRNSLLQSHLDQPSAWRRFAEWSELKEMGENFRPRDERIRQLLDEIVEYKGDGNKLLDLRERLSSAILDFERAIRPHNERLLASMAEQLSRLTRAVDQ